MARATATPERIRFEVCGFSTDAPGAPPDVLPLAEAVRIALRNDPRVQMALAHVEAALADSRQSRLLPNPVLSVAVRFPEGGGTPLIDAGLSAELIALLRRPAQTRAADNRLRVAAAEAVTAALDVIADVEETYAKTQSAEAMLAILGEQVQVNARLLQLAKDRLEAGEGNRLDVLSLDATRVELETDSVQRQADVTDGRLALARLIGRPSLDAGWKLDPMVTAWPWSGDERQWVTTALERRPEVQARTWELAALGDEVAASKLAAFEGAEAGVDSERDDGWSLGPSVSVPIPLLDWGQARRAKAQAQRVEARHLATQTRRQVVEEVRRAAARLRAAQATVRKVEGELLPLQQSRQQQVEESYRAGLADVTALLVAQQDLQASRAKLVEVRQDAVLALIQLRRAVGGAGAANSIPPPKPTTTTAPASAPTSRPSTRPSGVR